MNYKSELQRLQRLLQVDHNAYLNELDKPWSSMDEDLDLAIKILLKHASNSGGVPAHPWCRSGLSESIGEALDVTMWLLIQAPDGPAARPVVALA